MLCYTATVQSCRAEKTFSRFHCYHGNRAADTQRTLRAPQGHCSHLLGLPQLLGQRLTDPDQTLLVGQGGEGEHCGEERKAS